MDDRPTMRGHVMSTEIIFVLGAAAGFCIGYVIKKVRDFGAAGVGSCLLFLLLLSWAYGFGGEWPLSEWRLDQGQQLDQNWRWNALYSALRASVPALVGAIPGLILGLRKG